MLWPNTFCIQKILLCLCKVLLNNASIFIYNFHLQFSFQFTFFLFETENVYNFPTTNKNVIESDTYVFVLNNNSTNTHLAIKRLLPY